MPSIGQPVQYKGQAATILGINEDGTFELSVQTKNAAGSVSLELATATPEDVTTFGPDATLVPEPEKPAKKAKKDETLPE